MGLTVPARQKHRLTGFCRIAGGRTGPWVAGNNADIAGLSFIDHAIATQSIPCVSRIFRLGIQTAVGQRTAARRILGTASPKRQCYEAKP